jgi:Glycosyltransferase family 87
MSVLVRRGLRRKPTPRTPVANASFDVRRVSLSPATAAPGALRPAAEPRRRPRSRESRDGVRGPLLAGIAGLGVLAIVVCCFLLAAGAAGRPTGLVPASHGGFPGWLSGPLHGLNMRLSEQGFQRMELALCAAWVLVLLGADRLPLPLLLGGVGLADLLLVLGPVLLSQDAIGYLSFARLGALHGLDPYTHTSAAQPLDAVYPYLGWHNVTSPYGPLFTLASYALVPLGVAGGLWTLKACAGITAFAATVLVARAATVSGRRAGFAAAFVGLNPALLSFAVGGAHNDLLVLLLSSVALLFAGVGRPALAAAAGVVGAGVKVTAGVMLPYLLVARESAGRRKSILIAAAGTLLAVSVIALAGFGPHALDFVNALRGQQNRVSSHSVPAALASGLGIRGYPGWWRALVDGLSVAVALAALWATLRGGDWRTATGWAMLALVCSTVWLLSWYVVWILPFAALSRARTLHVATVLLTGYVIVYHLPLARTLGIV